LLYQIGWFSTGRGPGSRNLLKTILENIASGIINAKISFVFCSREEGEAEGSDLYLKMVKDQGLNLISFSSRKFKPEMRKQGKDDPNIMRQWRIEYDRKIMSLLNHHSADVNVLAGYMLIVGDEMCEKYNLINLHPAAPDGPAGTWQEVIWRLIEDRADPFIDPLWEKHEQKLKSKSLNQIIKEEGKNNELFKEIRKMGVIRELPLVVQTLKIFSEGKIGIKDKHIIVNDRIQHQPYCLTEQIEAFIKD